MQFVFFVSKCDLSNIRYAAGEFLVENRENAKTGEFRLTNSREDGMITIIKFPQEEAPPAVEKGNDQVSTGGAQAQRGSGRCKLP